MEGLFKYLKYFLVSNLKSIYTHVQEVSDTMNNFMVHLHVIISVNDFFFPMNIDLLDQKPPPIKQKNAK